MSPVYELESTSELGNWGTGELDWQTTCINMLTGMTSPDLFHETQTSIYGSSLLHDMDQIRYCESVRSPVPAARIRWFIVRDTLEGDILT